MYEISSREFQTIKEKLLFQLTNFGQPYITVEDGNYGNRGELYLSHRHEGIDLKLDYAGDTMRNLHKIWTRPIYLETVIDETPYLLSFDGNEFKKKKLK
jgi:stage V sporulation protein R